MLAERWSDLGYRLRALFRRAEMERELAAEIQDHLEREADRHRRAGLTPAEAKRRARIAFGGVDSVKEQSRDNRGLAALDAITQNVRYAWRSLRRRPGLVGGVTLTLGLGVGVNTAMFQILDRLLFAPPPYLRDAASVNRVYFDWRLNPGDLGMQGFTSGTHVYMPYTRFRDLTRWTTAFAQTATFASSGEMPVGSGQAARQVRVAAVSATFFSFFDAPAVIGRYFTPQEDSTPKGADVAVLGYAFWRSQYGGRSDVLGSRLQVGPGVFTVIGVAPKGFVGVGDADESWEDPTSGYGEPPSVFVPVTTFAATWADVSGPCGYATSYCNKWLQMIVRRRPGVSSSAASGNLTAAFQRSYLVQRTEASARNFVEWKRLFPPIEVARPRAIAGPVLAAQGPMESVTARVAIWVAGVAAIVLLIACANVTNLFLATARERRSEIALRLALGVSQWRLAAQLLTECLLLAGIGGVAALGVAQTGEVVLAPSFLPSDTGLSLLAQPRTLLFGVTATILVGIVTGLIPALRARRTDVIDALKGGSRDGSPERSQARALLLLAQGALCVVLLVGAGLFIRSVQNVRAVRLGFDVDPVLYAEVDPRGVKLDSSAERKLAQRMIEVAEAIPGVAEAARAYGGPFVGRGSFPLFVPGLGVVNRLGDFTFQANSPEYFHMVGTRIIGGRGFTRDDREHAPRVAVVSEATAQVLWPGQDAIGKRVQIGSDTMPYTTVIGIAENTIQYNLSDGRRLHYYLPFAQLDFDPGTVELLIRTKGNAGAYEVTVQRTLQRLMPDAAYLSLTAMEENLGPKVRSWQLGAVMFLAFGGLALIVAVVGLYSVISYDVARRRHELGIRTALGARMRHLLRVVAVDSALFAAIGVLVGGAIALATGPLIAPLLYAESPRDPVVFVGVVVTLAAAVIAATVAPVLRASRVDPGHALRVE